MDESKLRPGFPGDRSQAAAEKLRALRERANHALEGHRGRLGELETQLSERVRQLAEEFGTTLGSAAPTPDAGREDELEALRRQVAEGAAKHEKFVEQLVAARKQLDAIQSQPCASCQQAAHQLAAADDELRRVREQLEASLKAHEEDCARHEQFVEQLTAARQAINLLQLAAGESSAELRGELETARQAKVAAEETLAAAQRDLEALHSECDAMRSQAEALERDLQAQKQETISLQNYTASLDQDRGAAASEGAALRDQIEALTAALALTEANCEELGRLKAVAEQEKESLASALANIESLHAATQAEQSGLLELLAAADAETQDVRSQLAASEGEKLKLSLEISQAESVGEQFQHRLAEAERELNELRLQAAAGADAPALRAELSEAQAAAAAQAQQASELATALADARGELEQLRDTMASKSDLESARRECQSAQTAISELQAALVAANEAVAAAQAETASVLQASRPTVEFAELEQKFELALADAHKLKRENSGLREELAARPEAGDVESPELAGLRSERDALAARVAELEAAATAAESNGGDAQQEREDLQRRFEMAVDDVRQLKQENAKLREQLASAANGSSGGTAEDANGSDWAAQKARLMAMLAEEDDGGEISADRVTERATVTKTIAATDRVIANKDQEIAELRAALEMRGEGDAACDAEAAERQQLFDADDVVAAERARLTKLTAEWEDKLRAAELEFSVERAKLAREQAAVRDRMLELQSGNAQFNEVGEGGKPRRRWLAALGLHEDGDDAKKK